MRKWMFALVMACAAAPVSAQEPLTILGIPFNAPLAMPECPWKEERDYSSADRKATTLGYTNRQWSETGGTCYLRAIVDIGKPLQDGDRVAVLFPLSKAPSLGTVALRIAGGKVAYLTIRTRGYDAQELDFATLKERFGEPPSVDRPVQQNRMGATFETIEASWPQADGVSVIYSSALGALDEGIVIVSTPEGSAAEAKSLEDRRRQRQGTQL